MAKSISQLTTQATANETDLFEVAIADQNSASGYASKKESAAAIAEGIVNQYTYPLGMPNMQAKTILGAINQLLANVAAVYDSTQTYAVGAFVTYNGQLYKCNTTVDTAETFDPTKWDVVNLADNLGSGGGMYDYSTTEQVVGTWFDGKPYYKKSWLINLPASMQANVGVKFSEASIPDLESVVRVEWNLYQSGWIGNPVNIFWYSPAQIGYSGQETDGVTFFFGGSAYANQKILYTCLYTKTTD